MPVSLLVDRQVYGASINFVVKGMQTLTINIA